MQIPETQASKASGSLGASMRVGRKSMTLRERSTDMLRQAIIDHRLPPGTHLKERELCEMLDVSRTSVREALRHLESEQLIETVPHRGPVVVTLTARDARDLYKVRAALEGLAGELFAEHATDQHIADLSRIGRAMAVSAEENHPDVTLGLISEFYKILFDGADNGVCAHFIHSLNARISMLRRMSLASVGRPKAMMKDVERIVDAATARDPEALKKACMDHVEGACAAVMPQLIENENIRENQD